jgi:uncharacterized membrane protein
VQVASPAELSAQSSRQSSHLDVPSAASDAKPRPRRKTLSERAQEIHAKAVQHAEQGDPPPIIKDTILGIPPLMWIGLAIIGLLSVELFGLHTFAKIAAFGLAPIAALWLLPIPSVAYSEPGPPPQPADNVGWM